MRSGLVGLVLGALAFAACGDEPAPLPRAASAALPSGASAFRLATEPEAVLHSIPLEFVRNGIGRPDPRDAIPALFDPVFVTASDADFVPQDARLIVTEVEGEVRAYPIPLLDRHELVNDAIQGRPILVSWCPLCGSAVVFEREVEGHVLTFGVSGFLYRSDVLMYDRETESFWSQLHQGAVAGPFTGAPLTERPSHVTTFEALRASHPQARVLRKARGMLPGPAYETAPYADYLRDDRLWFPVGEVRPDLPPKVEVLGVLVGDAAWAFPLADLRALAAGASEATLAHQVGGERLRITWRALGDEVRVHTAAGQERAAIRLFWFAWAAFRPETGLWRLAG